MVLVLRLEGHRFHAGADIVFAGSAKMFSGPEAVHHGAEPEYTGFFFFFLVHVLCLLSTHCMGALLVLSFIFLPCPILKAHSNSEILYKII